MSLAPVTILNRLTPTVPPPQGLERTLTSVKSAIQTIDVTVGLERAKDKASPARVERAERVKAVLQDRLNQLFSSPATTCSTRNDDKNNERHGQSQLVLNVCLVLASEGSRAARFWAAEFGFGLAKLAVLWKLSSSTTTTSDDSFNTIYMGSRMAKASSAGCGLADMCQSDAGDRALDVMAEQVTQAIQKYMKDAWQLT